MRLKLKDPSRKSPEFELTNDLIVNQGGEALICKDPESPNAFALKIYHDPDKHREAKLRDFAPAAKGLGHSVIAPLEFVFNNKNDIVGFRMRRLSPRYRKLSMLFKPSFCADHGFTGKAKTKFFLGMADDLQQIHSKGFVVGDLSAANQMVEEDTKALAWIDVDGWQFGKHPCMVATQLYVSPELYGIDLSKKPSFMPRHDWWSYVVILTQGLLNGIHPLKSGIHPKIISPLDRAAKGITVFDNDVSYPNVGLPAEILSDELAHAITVMLKKRGDSFPIDTLQHYGDILIECKSCKVWHPATRSKCPVCSSKTVVDIDLALKIAGIEVMELIKTRGRILHFNRNGTIVRVIAEEAGELVLYQKEEHAPSAKKMEIGLSVHSGSMYKYAGNTIVVCPEPTERESTLFILDISTGEAIPIGQLTTRALEGARAVFATSNTGTIFRISNRMLVASERRGNGFADRPVMQVFDGQTWFTADPDPIKGEECIIGFHREFDKTNWFISRQTKNGTFATHKLALVPLNKGESFIDFTIRFSSETILIARQIRVRGIDKVIIEVVKANDASVLSSRIVKTIDNPQWDVVNGKAFGNKKILHATSGGVIREDAVTGDLIKLEGTKKCVTSDDALDRMGNSIIVVKEDKVLMIRHR